MAVDMRSSYRLLVHAVVPAKGNRKLGGRDKGGKGKGTMQGRQRAERRYGIQGRSGGEGGELRTGWGGRKTAGRAEVRKKDRTWDGQRSRVSSIGVAKGRVDFHV